MKKIICAILAVFMLVSLCGCQDMLETLASLNDEVLSDNDSSVDDVEIEIDVSPEFDLGEIVGDTYINEMADINFTLPEGWSFGSDAEKAELTEVSVTYFTGDDAEEKLSEVATVYSMVAADADEMADVQFIIENSELVGNDNSSAKGYVMLLSHQIKNLYTESGATCEAGEIENIMIGDQEYTSVIFDIEMEGVPLQQLFACRKEGKYFFALTLSSFLEDGVEPILKSFE